MIYPGGITFEIQGLVFGFWLVEMGFHTDMFNQYKSWHYATVKGEIPNNPFK